MDGLCVVRSVEVEYRTERGSAINQNAHIPTTKNVMEVAMKRRSVMNSVAQVCQYYHAI